MKPKVILLVEDNTDTREIYRTILAQAGYEVLEARDGDEGLALACERKPDLVLMNISIPDVDGWTATTLLKQDPRTESIPVVAVTAFSRAANVEKARSAGCDGYLDKPVGPQRILEEVRSRVGPASGASDAAS